jgi:hypothetical protein
VGSYCGLVKGDWKKALSYLANGSDSNLKKLAEEDIKSEPANADAQAERGDMWWDKAEASEGAAKLVMLRRAAFWYVEAQPNVTGVLAKVTVEKRLEELAKAGFETTRPSVPIKRRFPLLTSPNKLIGWDVGDREPAYQKGILELQDGCLFCPIVVKDAILAAKITRTKVMGSVYLVLRNSDAGCYAAGIDGNFLRIFRLKPALNVNKIPQRGVWTSEVLAQWPLAARVGPVCTLTFSASDKMLAASINNDPRPLTAPADGTFEQGTVGVGAMGAQVLVEDIELFIPNRASFVADLRGAEGSSRACPPGGLPSPPAN